MSLKIKIGDDFVIENILTVGNQVLVLFILVFIGFLCNKTKILTKISVKDLTNFVLYFVTPCVIINSFSREFNKSMLSGLIVTLCAAFLSFGINILIAHIFVRDKDSKKPFNIFLLFIRIVKLLKPRFVNVS